MKTQETIRAAKLGVLSNAHSRPKWSMGAKFEQKNGLNTPGPGQYEQNGAFEVNRYKQSWYTRSQQRCPSKSGAPGPGAYNTSDAQFQAAPKWTLHARSTYGKSDATPGPGTYQVSPPKPSQNFRFGTAKRSTSPSCAHIAKASEAVQSSVADNFRNGAQMHNQNQKLNSKAVGAIDSPYQGATSEYRQANHPLMSLAGKASGSQMPGPGAYEGISYVAANGPKWSFGAKHGETKHATANNPGPGQYTSNVPHTTPHWSFSKSHPPTNVESRAPGPGAYEVSVPIGKNPMYTTTLEAATGNHGSCGKGAKRAHTVAISFSHQPRMEARPPTVPGPGAYTVEQSPAGPKWSMSPKLKDVHSGVKSSSVGEMFSSFNY